MLKYKIFLWLLLGCIPIFSFASAQTVELSDSDYQYYKQDKWWDRSDAFKSSQLCQESKISFDSKYSTYKRSECFSYKWKHYYFICSLDENCSIQTSTKPLQKTIQTSSGQLKESYKKALDTFLANLKTSVEKMDTEKREKYLDNLISQLNTLSGKFQWNANIAAMIDYLNIGITEMKKKEMSDEERFLCLLTGECRDNDETPDSPPGDNGWWRGKEIPSPTEDSKICTKEAKVVCGENGKKYTLWRSSELNCDWDYSEMNGVKVDETGNACKKNDIPTSKTPKVYLSTDKNDSTQRHTNVNQSTGYLILTWLNKKEFVSVCITKKAEFIEKACDDEKNFILKLSDVDDQWINDEIFMYKAPLALDSKATYIVKLLDTNGTIHAVGNFTNTSNISTNCQQDLKMVCGVDGKMHGAENFPYSCQLDDKKAEWVRIDPTGQACNTPDNNPGGWFTPPPQAINQAINQVRIQEDDLHLHHQMKIQILQMYVLEQSLCLQEP